MITSLGNNDSQYHNQAPNEDMKSDFYGFLYDLWFTGMPGNAELADDPTVKSSFMEGGYYRADVDDKISVLAINS